MCQAVVGRSAANPFIEHHGHGIGFQYSCFDRMLLNALVQPMQQPAMIVDFLDKVKHAPSITRAYFRQVSEDYHRFLAGVAAEHSIKMVEPPPKVCAERIGSSRSIGSSADASGSSLFSKPRKHHSRRQLPSPGGGNRIDFCPRFVWQYYFYLRDHDWGRICPYFPFNARVCINQHVRHEAPSNPSGDERAPPLGCRSSRAKRRAA